MAYIPGTASSDTLTDTVNDDTIDGYAGNDTISITYGRDYIDGGADDDTLIFLWSDATQDSYFSNYAGSSAYVNTNTDFNDSTRRAQYADIEHLDVRAGSGDDSIRGSQNSWDKIDGGAGVDLWEDSFSGTATALTIDMANMATGVTLADGSVIRNIERATLSLSSGNDSFSDSGDYDDSISSYAGNDTLTTSGGRDFFDGGADEDTVGIDWSTATDDVTVGSTQAYVNTGTDFNDSTRRVSYIDVEHFDVKSGSGDDTLAGHTDAWDKLDGGAGTDVWQDDFSGKDTPIIVDMADMATGVTLADGSVIRNVEKADLDLSTGNDSFADAGAYDDTVSTYAGDDVLKTSGGRDSFDGGIGTDTLTIDWGDATEDAFVNIASAYVNTGTGFADSTRRVSFTDIEKLVVQLGSGADSAEGSTMINEFHGGAGNDTLNGYNQNDQLYGDADNDRLDGGTGTDTMVGGTGDDTYVVDNAGDTVTEVAGEGTDTVETALAAPATLAANVENLTYTGTASFAGTGNGLANTITGGAADDTLDGGTGADTLKGLGGNDTYIVDNRGDRVNESIGAGTDKVNTTLAAYTLTANVENLKYTGTDDFSGTGNGLANVLAGAAGNDRLDGRAGGDTMLGGAGSDIYIVDNARDKVSEAGGGGANDLVKTSVNFALGSGLENLTLLGRGNLKGTGNDAGNDITGNTGHNLLNGKGGGDLLLGNGGNDTLDGGAGRDVMKGGAGDDLFFVDNTRDKVAGGTGHDLVKASTNFTLAADVEDLILTGNANLAGTGNNGRNEITGNRGNNELHGKGGNDTLNGGAGNDKLFGDGGNDLLNGGGGKKDMAVYSGKLAKFDFKELSGGRVKVIDHSHSNGTDILTGIELIKIGGHVYDLHDLLA